METLFNVKLNKNISPVIYDVIRMITIQVITQFLFVMNGNNISFFNMQFIKTTIFICLSIMIYWLIVKKIINFYDPNDENN